MNNTLQIVYAENNAEPEKVVYEGWPVLDDTEFVPVLARKMAPADIEYDLHVWFDVRFSSPFCMPMGSELMPTDLR